VRVNEKKWEQGGMSKKCKHRPKKGRDNSSLGSTGKKGGGSQRGNSGAGVQEREGEKGRDMIWGQRFTGYGGGVAGEGNRYL